MAAQTPMPAAPQNHMDYAEEYRQDHKKRLDEAKAVGWNTTVRWLAGGSVFGGVCVLAATRLFPKFRKNVPHNYKLLMALSPGILSAYARSEQAVLKLAYKHAYGTDKVGSSIANEARPPGMVYSDIPVVDWFLQHQTRWCVGTWLSVVGIAFWRTKKMTGLNMGQRITWTRVIAQVAGVGVVSVFMMLQALFPPPRMAPAVEYDFSLPPSKPIMSRSTALQYSPDSASEVPVELSKQLQEDLTQLRFYSPDSDVRVELTDSIATGGVSEKI